MTITSPQLTTTQEHLYELEKKLESPENKGRVRLLKGTDPSPDKLEEDCKSNKYRILILVSSYCRLYRIVMYAFCGADQL